ncbi:MAG: hypothetical protein ACD_47C00420G0001 [uncultured bacterium]|nr:MAG: hypothetical protein ACD_47C00420G0001 [uncultured bacterium]
MKIAPPSSRIMSVCLSVPSFNMDMLVVVAPPSMRHVVPTAARSSSRALMAASWSTSMTRVSIFMPAVRSSDWKSDTFDLSAET